MNINHNFTMYKILCTGTKYYIIKQLVTNVTYVKTRYLPTDTFEWRQILGEKELL